MVEEELRREAKKAERSSLHSAWVHETSVQDDANLGGAVEECEIDRVAWPVHQKILG